MDKISRFTSWSFKHATVKISDHEVLIFGGLDASSSATGDELFLLCNTNTNSYTPVKPIGDNDNHPIKIYKVRV